MSGITSRPRRGKDSRSSSSRTSTPSPDPLVAIVTRATSVNITRVNSFRSTGSVEADIERDVVRDVERIRERSGERNRERVGERDRGRSGERDRERVGEREGEGEGEGYTEGDVDLEGSTSIYSIRSDEEEGSRERGDTVRICSHL